MRFFIALEVPEENRKQLEVVQKQLQELIPSARLTENPKLHLTIAFVGDEPAEFKDKLIQKIEAAASDIHPFEVTPAYLDGFPTLHHPHTLWVGVKGDIDKLLHIREKIKDGLVELGLQVDERRFIPHIAVAKTKDFWITTQQEDSLDQIMAHPFNPIVVSSIKLFESIPQDEFHTHSTLAEIKLV